MILATSFTKLRKETTLIHHEWFKKWGGAGSEFSIESGKETNVKRCAIKLV